MNESERLAARLERLHAGNAWHGAPVRAVLAGIDAPQAVWRPVPHVHSIHEILLHMTAWTDEVRRRLEGGAPGEPVEGDWPPVRDPSPTGWQQALAAHEAAHAALVAAVGRCDPERLEDLVGMAHDTPPAAAVTFSIMLHGLVEHEAYHCGQIGLLKKAVQSGAAGSP